MERQIISVDISPRKGIIPQLRVAQGDIGRPLGVYIMQDGAALDCSSYTADLYVLKADGNYFVAHATIDSTTNNLVTWETAEQETPVAGECAAQIRIMSGADDIGTARFVEYVEASPGFCGAGSESAVESLEEYVRQAAESATTASTAATTATGAAASASADAQTASGAATTATGAAETATAAAETASDAAESAQDVLDSIPEDYTALSDDVNDLKTAIEEITEIEEPINYAVIDTAHLYSIPDDMTVSIADGAVTFSYPYASGNKGNFGFLIDNLVSGKTYVASFTVVSGGLSAESNQKINAVTATLQNKTVINRFTKNGSTYTCEFTAVLQGDIAYNSIAFGMQRSISTTVTLTNFSVMEKNASAKTLVKVDSVSQFPTNPCDYDGTEISLFKKILCVGDSLTQGVCNFVYQGTTVINVSFPDYAYPTFLKKLSGCDVTNAGQAGATIADWYASKAATDYSGHDAAIIQLGVNDALGSGWTQEAETALGNIITKLKTENTGIKIFVATIIPAFAYSGESFDEVSDGLRDFVAGLADTDVILLDIAEYGHTADETAYNNGHLTAIGYLKLASDYKSYISNIVARNTMDFRFVHLIGTNYRPY